MGLNRCSPTCFGIGHIRTSTADGTKTRSYASRAICPGSPLPASSARHRFQIGPVPWLATSPAMRIGVCSKAPGPWTRSMPLRSPAMCKARTTAWLHKWPKATAALYAHVFGDTSSGTGINDLLADASARHSMACRPRRCSRPLSEREFLAPANGSGTRRGICRGSPRLIRPSRRRPAGKLDPSCACVCPAPPAPAIAVDAGAVGGAKTGRKFQRQHARKEQEPWRRWRFSGLA